MPNFDPLLAYLDDQPTARWNYPQPLGAPAELTYSFMQSVPVYSDYNDPGAHPGFAPLDAAMQAAVRQAFAAWAAVANITFSQVPDAGPGGDIRIGSFDTTALPAGAQGKNAGGYSFYPAFNDGAPMGIGGDVYLGRYPQNAETAPGQYGLETVTHEIGHAIGLKHPFEGSLTLPVTEQELDHSIMNYKTPAEAQVVSVTGTATDYSYVVQPLYPSTPMLYDIAAVQSLYGANIEHATGDDTYGWAANARFFQTIWDAGGTDTIDTSNQTLNSAIDLRDGHYSSIAMRDTYAEKRLEIPAFATEAPTPTYDGNNNLAIAYGAVIENAKGGAGNDTIIGNAAANTLDGGDGADTLRSQAGNDTLNGASGHGEADLLVGGAGNDTYVIDSASDVVSEAAGQGTDTVHFRAPGGSYALPANVENLVLEGTARVGGGNELANVITGNAAGNWLMGGAGNDTLDGAAGGDMLFGGDGVDVFVFRPGSGGDRIGDFIHGEDHIRLAGFAGLSSFQQVLGHATDQLGGVKIDLNAAGDSLTLAGIAKSALAADDFIFA